MPRTKSTGTLILHDGSLGTAVRMGSGFDIRNILTDELDGLERPWAEVRIVVRDAYYLQGIRALLEACGTALKLSVRVDSRVPNTVLHAPSGFVGGRTVVEVSRTESSSVTTLLVGLSREARTWVIFSTCTSTHGQALLPLRELRVGLTHGLYPGWFGLHSNVSLSHLDSTTIDLENPGPIPFFDTHIRGIDDQSPESSNIDTALISHVFTTHEEPSWEQSSVERRPLTLPPFDQRLFNPIGAIHNPENGLAYVQPQGDGGLALSSGDTIIGSSDGALETKLIDALRSYRGIVDLGSAHRGPIQRAQFIYQALASGVPVIAADARSTLSGIMPDEVLDAICTDETEILDQTDREIRIFTQVRAVHRALPGIVAKVRGSHPDRRDNRTVSAVISTKRPDYVGHAVQSYLSQTWPNKELLLGFHGFTINDVDPEVQALIAQVGSYVEFGSDAIFGDVLRELTFAAQGQIIAKMDDDDWYSPYHLEDLVYALGYSGAQIVGSGVQFIYVHSADATIRRRSSIGYLYGVHPGGPTILAPKSVILEAGNWPRVRRAIDSGLNNAILRLGGSSFRAHPHNFLFNRRSSGHTWNVTDEYFTDEASETWNGLIKPPGFGDTELYSAHWRSPAPQSDEER